MDYGGPGPNMPSCAPGLTDTPTPRHTPTTLLRAHSQERVSHYERKRGADLYQQSLGMMPGSSSLAGGSGSGLAQQQQQQPFNPYGAGPSGERHGDMTRFQIQDIGRGIRQG